MPTRYKAFAKKYFMFYSIVLRMIRKLKINIMLLSKAFVKKDGYINYLRVLIEMRDVQDNT